MKKGIVILSLIFFMIACDDKIKSLEALNRAPDIEYFSRSSIDWAFVQDRIIDTAKTYNPQNNANYAVALRAKDVNKNFQNITITEVENGGQFFIDKELFTEQKEVALDSFSLAYRYPLSGTRLFTVKSLDDFGKFSEVFFEILFLDNVVPTAAFEIRSNNNNGQIEHILDANNSIDGDAKIGGFIINYEFTVDDVIINAVAPQIKHIFPAGDHVISLRVQDNDQAWSNPIIINLKTS